MNVSEKKGEIITFYSYKGGTGRTMALANTACLLAEQQLKIQGKGVLMIDWDLEAPGLHRYFNKHLPKATVVKSSDSPDTPIKPGLIDLFYDLNEALSKPVEMLSSSSREPGTESSQSPNSERVARGVLVNIGMDKYITQTTIDKLHLLKAGTFDNANSEEYGERINTFDWEALYNKSPHLIRLFAETLAELYAYVLIDSRTGVTDVSGICTALLPEKLVIVFTPNMQSLEGGLDLITRATEYRKESADLRPLMIYPLVSRVASEEPDLRSIWRFGNHEAEIPGYQNKFEQVLSKIYGRKEISLDNYFDEIQIQHVSRYAYGEEIAVLTDKIEDRFSLRRSYETFKNRLTKLGVPWEEKKKQYATKRCFVIMGFGIKTDYATGRKLDLDKSYKLLIKPVVEQKGMVCVRADEISRTEAIDAQIYNELMTADIVIADISAGLIGTSYLLGMRHALRPRGTIIISEDRATHPFELNHMRVNSYAHLGDAIDYDEVLRFQKVLADTLEIVLNTEDIDSPLYLYLPSVVPPSLMQTSAQGRWKPLS